MLKFWHVASLRLAKGLVSIRWILVTIVEVTRLSQQSSAVIAVSAMFLQLVGYVFGFELSRNLSSIHVSRLSFVTVVIVCRNI